MVVGFVDKPKHNYFGSFAKYYDLVTTRAAYRTQQVMVSFLDKLFMKTHVKDLLEVGVGTGRLAVPLAKNGYCLTGLDLNKELLKLAEKKARKENVKLRLFCKNMLDLDFREAFDAVLLGGGVFYYLNNNTDATKAFAAFYRSLRRGGVLLLDMVNWDFVRAHFKPEDVWDAKKSNVLVRMHNKHKMCFKTKTFTHTSYVYVKDRGTVKRCVDVHKLHMWTNKDLENFANKAGFSKVKLLYNKEGAALKFDKSNHRHFWLYGVKE